MEGGRADTPRVCRSSPPSVWTCSEMVPGVPQHCEETALESSIFLPNLVLRFATGRGAALYATTRPAGD
jgi:hypothetical protein